MRNLRRLIGITLLMATLSACNTIEGMGRDIRGAGEAISGSASQTKEKMR